MLHILITVTVASLIVALGLAVYFNFHTGATRSLNDELSLLSRRRKELRNINIGSAPFEANQAPVLITLEGSTALTDRFIADLTSQAHSGLTSVDIESALNEVSVQLSERITWSRFFASFAVYFGLVGTIAGLWIALNNLQGATQIHDESTLRTFAESIKALLGSLQGAFLSAGLGVVGSVLMGWQVQTYDAKCEGYLSRLNEMGHRELLPYLERQRLETLPTDSLEAARALVTQLGRTLNGFTKAWSDRFDTLAKETGTVAESTSKLVETSKSLEAASDTMAESASALDGTLKQLTSATAEEVRALQQSRQAIESASRSVEALAEKAVSWPDISERLAETSSSVESAGDSVRASADGLQEATTALQDALSGLQEHVREISDESFEDLSEKLARAIAEVVSQATSELAKITEGARLRDERVESMVKAIASLVERQERYLTDITVAVNGMIGLIPVLEDPRPTLEQLLANLRSVSDSIDRVATTLGGGAPEESGGLKVHDSRELVDIKNQLADIALALGNYRQLRELANSKLEQIHRTLSDHDGRPTSGTASADGHEKRRRFNPFGGKK